MKTKADWQKHHGFDDETMELIDSCKQTFGGKIMKVRNKEEYAAWRLEEKEKSKAKFKRLCFKQQS
jgi:hypothetical protein